MKARICMVISPLYPPRYGGGAKFPITLSNELLNFSDVEITHITTWIKGQKIKTNKKNLTIYRLPTIARFGFRIENYVYAFANSLFLLIKGNEFDIVYICGAYPFAIGAILMTRLINKKCIVRMTEMKSDDPISIKKRFMGNLQLSCFSLAEKFVSISNEISHSYLLASLPKDKLIEITNGVDVNKFHPVDNNIKYDLRDKFNLPIDRKIFLFVGSITKRKGVDILINAWIKIKHLNENICPFLLLVGPTDVSSVADNNKFVDWINNEILINNLVKDVRIDDFTDQIELYYQLSDFFLLLSRSEGMPSVLLEAMSCGLPTISSISSGSSYFVRNNVNGYLIQDENIEELLKNIDLLISNDEIIHKFGKLARETIINEASIEICAKEHMDLFLSLKDA